MVAALVGHRRPTEYLWPSRQCEPARSATLTQAARNQQDVCNYVNGGIQWRAGSASADGPVTKYVAQLFDAGERLRGRAPGRHPLRLGGVPAVPLPFEGARLEIASRF